MLILVVIGFLLIALMEVPVMIYRGQTRELRAFWVLLGLSFLFTLAVTQRWPLPNPNEFLETLLRPVVKMMAG